MRRTVLLAGPYAPPRVKRHDVLFCQRRGCDVRVTSWTDGRIPWPKRIPLEGFSAPSPILTGDLVRAVQIEATEALKFWFGVSGKTVWKWRRPLEVEGTFGAVGSP